MSVEDVYDLLEIHAVDLHNRILLTPDPKDR